MREIAVVHGTCENSPFINLFSFRKAGLSRLHVRLRRRYVIINTNIKKRVIFKRNQEKLQTGVSCVPQIRVRIIAR